MDKKAWKTKIKGATKKAGTYKPFFDAPIETLADILSRRDGAVQLFEEQGFVYMIEHTNRGGETNLEKNPLLSMINELNRDALSYWRDLGLTPAGLKKLNELALKDEKKASALEKALEKLNG